MNTTVCIEDDTVTEHIGHMAFIDIVTVNTSQPCLVYNLYIMVSILTLHSSPRVGLVYGTDGPYIFSSWGLVNHMNTSERGGGEGKRESVAK